MRTAKPLDFVHVKTGTKIIMQILISFIKELMKIHCEKVMRKILSYSCSQDSSHYLRREAFGNKKIVVTKKEA